MYSGRRTPEAESRRMQRRAAREYIITLSYNDHLLGEKISRTDPDEVKDYLLSVFSYWDSAALPCAFKGVVLSDGRGTGVFQQ